MLFYYYYFQYNFSEIINHGMVKDADSSPAEFNFRLIKSLYPD